MTDTPREDTQAYVRGQVVDLGRQARNGFKTVQRLVDSMVSMLDDAECDGSTGHCMTSRSDAETVLQEAEYFLKTGHLLRGDENDRTDIERRSIEERREED